MPRSKRNKQIELAKTKKRGLEWKKRLFEEVRSCVDKYENVFIFSVNDMRNNKMKTVRDQWKHSRFFIGKNKIMAMALGRFTEEEYKPNLHKLGQQIKGQRGLLFSNKSVEEVLSWFRSYSEGDYARSGNTATQTVNLPAGPLTMFPHSLEPYLRELGLPTSLEKGVIHLIKDHEVCKAGDVLTPESAKILKLLKYEMAEFHLTIDCVWSKDRSFLQLTENTDNDTKENKKQYKKSSLSSESMKKNNTTEDEQMEIEHDEEESSDNDEDEEESSDNDKDEEEKESEKMENNISGDGDVKSNLNNIITISSTPKYKTSDAVENNVSIVNEDRETLGCSIIEMSEENDVKEVSEEINDKNMEKISEKTDSACNIEEMSEKCDDNISEKNEEKVLNAKKGRPRVEKTPKKTKKENVSIRELKTPDANTSQESPVFRELRNRSVKVVRKKKVINKR